MRLKPWWFTQKGEDDREGFEGIVGSSAALMEVLDLVRTVAPSDSTVLIKGESGTSNNSLPELFMPTTGGGIDRL